MKSITWTSSLSFPGLLAAAIAITLLIVAAMGYQGEWWHFSTTLRLFDWAGYGAWLGLALSLFGGWMAWRQHRRVRFASGVAGVILALPVAIMAIQFAWAAHAHPPINDVTTDPGDPPMFWDVPNPRAYPGAGVAELQREGYPELKPLKLESAPEEVFERAEELVWERGWAIVAANPMDGQIEAVDSTPLFGFKDNVVIRVLPENGGSRVDMRSHSRLGRIDRGVNARRIRAFLADLVDAAG